jgi:hypothetical protein
MIFHCVTCGTRVYGPIKVKALVAEFEAAVQAATAIEERRKEEELRWLDAQAEAERKRKDEEARIEAERTSALKKAARRAALEREILRNAKCAWPPCPNDHTTTSLYCSRTCSNKNAHAREKAKQLAAKAALRSRT